MEAEHHFISHALKGDNIGLEPIDDGLWNILYYNTLLGRLSQRTGKITGGLRSARTSVNDAPGHL
jgi:hypothetical protein